METTAFFTLLGYVSGSVLYALVFARLFHKDILTGTRDQNPGVANAFQKGGFLCGALTLCCELLKGALPTALYLRHGGGEAGLLLVMAAPVLGMLPSCTMSSDSLKVQIFPATYAVFQSCFRSVRPRI